MTALVVLCASAVAFPYLRSARALLLGASRVPTRGKRGGLRLRALACMIVVAALAGLVTNALGWLPAPPHAPLILIAALIAAAVDFVLDRRQKHRP